MTGHACPECGGQRPGCACARAADRSAELAAAEDFDPLRIRPYVTLDAHDEAADPPTAQLSAIRPGAVRPGTGAGAGAGADAGVHGAGAHGTEAYGAGGGAHEGQTQVIPAYGSEGPAAGPYGSEGYGPEGYGPEEYGPEGGAHETMPLLLGGVGGAGGAGGSGPGGGRRERPRKRRGALVAGVAAAAVVGTAALAAAVLGGEDPDDRALVPEVTTSASLNLAVSEEPSPSSSAPTPSRTPSRTPSPRTSSPTPTATTASPSASATASASTAPPSVTASPSATGGAAVSAAPPAVSATPTTTPPTPSHTDAPEGATLSVGDTGPEVEELQRRLRFKWIYLGEIDGVFDEDVRQAVATFQSWLYPKKDPEGVYGSSTRRALERETQRMDG
ncbi:peptidoglycan-binding protein [Streptomyces sp. NPDC088090]|uniref:peptidoglycan-binding domain-containing protein n=1 Tax=Streptomyces sp. NPDC088090 TaxID=3365822 RepID=UPI00384DFB78